MANRADWLRAAAIKKETNMPSAPSFPVQRNEIAGIGVREIAEEFGTPTYVYNAAKIVERLDDLKAFDVVRYAPKACSNLAVLDLVRRHGGLVDTQLLGHFVGGAALFRGFAEDAAFDGFDLYALRAIRRDEEITIDYGWDV